MSQLNIAFAILITVNVGLCILIYIRQRRLHAQLWDARHELRHIWNELGEVTSGTSIYIIDEDDAPW